MPRGSTRPLPVCAEVCRRCERACDDLLAPNPLTAANPATGNAAAVLASHANAGWRLWVTSPRGRRGGSRRERDGSPLGQLIALDVELAEGRDAAGQSGKAPRRRRRA
jgi:hypothetical protein